MLTKTKLVLAAALMLGSASAALAGDQNEERGGYVLPGNTDGVNPVYHPRWFLGYAAQRGNIGNAGEAYGYAPVPKPKHRISHERTQDR
jgi:hypothetical protein